MIPTTCRDTLARIRTTTLIPTKAFRLVFDWTNSDGTCGRPIMQQLFETENGEVLWRNIPKVAERAT